LILALLLLFWGLLGVLTSQPPFSWWEIFLVFYHLFCPHSPWIWCSI
jgi:hypothetical protein